MEYFLILFGTMVVMYIALSFVWRSKKKEPKQPAKFTVDIIDAIIYFEGGDKLHKKFEGTVTKRCSVAYTHIMYYYDYYTPHDMFRDWLIHNNESRFVYVDNETLVPVEKITQIGLERSSKVIEVESL